MPGRRWYWPGVKTIVTAGIGVVVGALAVTIAFVILGDDEVRDRQVTSTALPTCTEVIPDSVFDALAWRSAAPATEHVARCEKYGDDGLITVGDRVVVASTADRADEARKVYERMCTDLFRAGSPTPERASDWLPADTTACVRMLPTGKDMGLAELVLLTADDDVVQVRVAALQPTRRQDLEAGLNQLVEAAEAAW